jgi:hypothetical protein
VTLTHYPAVQEKSAAMRMRMLVVVPLIAFLSLAALFMLRLVA